MATQLGNVNLFVTDIARARRFYVEALGLVEDTERSAPPSFVLLRAGEVTLTLQDGSAPGAIVGQPEGVELGFVVDNVTTIRDQIAAFGGTVSAVQEMGWGGGFDATDPDGHRLTIYRMR
jgi:catechol 2,3-dioxygenase-like lactoylglutathione lyase family enzyme